MSDNVFRMLSSFLYFPAICPQEMELFNAYGLSVQQLPVTLVSLQLTFKEVTPYLIFILLFNII